MMKKYVMLCAAIFSCLNSPGFAGSLQSLNKTDTLQLFSGKTISTPVSKIQGVLISNPFKGYFSADGIMKAKFSNQLGNQAKNDTGKWVVNNEGDLCVTWQHWGGSTQHCMSLYKLSNGYILIDNDSNSFETLIPITGISSGNTLDE